ncbi:hypothetical protein KDW_13080 [Dictyobacter vulcani]|uniref:3'-5' exonuclease domain-containing protein n=1 Tax=Dictyobacter vulcani TaxID=2607529 RepID=A0A5J4KPN2_9CHLR|nr:HEAT repeat domain-containing protein [Dictyobacter vulcani]GER87146.1 hypothetical protein KDW_13080 [Dictyobacter vulcani]
MSDNSPLIDLENLENLHGYLGPTPPQGILPQRGERFWVDRPAQLANAVNLLKQSGVVAVDAEFTQVRSRTQGEAVSNIPRLALLQLAIENHCFVVDALRLQDLSPLVEVVGNPAIAVLLHGAGADMRVMAERGLQVVHYYDLEATCRSIFGQHESSLAAMLQRAFGYHLDKSLQRTDWTRRPLPPAMVAYAARDAEVTLALYHWLDLHHHEILQLHETAGKSDQVAHWIEPFLRGNSALSPEMAVSEAKAQGLIHNRAQVAADCRAALVKVKHPMRRNRLLRLIADLSLTQLTGELLLLLQAPTSDERAASARALGRMSIQSAIEPITALLNDPVLDVRKAAQTALRNLLTKDTRQTRPAPARALDGTRSWVVENTQSSNDDDNGWKSRLRSIIDA